MLRKHLADSGLGLGGEALIFCRRPFLEYSFLLFSTLSPSKVLWLSLVTHIPPPVMPPPPPDTPIPCQHTDTVPSVCFLTFYVEPWFCSSPGKILSLSEPLSPCAPGWAESSVCICYVSPCAGYWSGSFTCLSLVFLPTIPGGVCCHHAQFAMRKWQQSCRNGIWIQAVWPPSRCS